MVPGGKAEYAVCQSEVWSKEPLLLSDRLVGILMVLEVILFCSP
jgi:hypothetical protein